MPGPTDVPPALEARARELAKGDRSLRFAGGAALWWRGGTRPALVALAAAGDPVLGRFEGTAADTGDGFQVLEAERSPANAAALRAVLGNLQPVPLGLATSAGFGDRLGLATPGHALALERTGAT